MASENPNVPNGLPEELPPRPENHEVERRLLRVETVSDALARLNKAILAAKDRYSPNDSFCATILTSFIEKQKDPLTGAGNKFAEVYQNTVDTVARLNTAFGRFLKNPGSLRTGILALLEINEETKKRLESTEAKFLVTAAMEAGESSPERLAVLALLSLALQEPSERSADERTYETLFFNNMNMAQFLSLLESILPSP